MKKNPTYEELQQRVAELAHAESELKRTQEREGYIKKVLLAVRNVNQIIVKEKDPRRLIESACKRLTGTLGYYNAWMALFDRAAPRVEMTAGAGFDGAFEELQAGLESGQFPDCMKQVFSSKADRLVVVNDPPSECRVCPLAQDYAGRAGLCQRLASGGRVYGILCASVPKAYARDREAQALFLELGADLAFALEKIDVSASLERREAELSATFYSIGDGVISTDIGGRVVRMNPVAEKLTGWPQRAASGKPIEKVFCIINEKTRQPAENPVRRVLEEGVTAGLANHTLLISKEGKEIPIGDSGAPLRDARGRMTGAVLVFRDVSHEYLNRRLLEIRLSLIGYAADHTLAELLTRVLDETGELVKSPIGFYHFVAPDQKTLYLQQWSTRTLNEFCRIEERHIHYSVDEAGVWTDCVHTKQPVVHNDYNALSHKKGMPEGHAEVIRELVVPVIREDRVVAILGVGNKPGDYTDKDVETVSYLADVTWEIVRKKQAEEKLRENEEKFRDIFNSSNDAIFIHDMAGRFLEVNGVACSRLGYTRDELLQMTVADIDMTDMETGEAFHEKSRVVFQAGTHVFESVHAGKDGTEFPVEISSRKIAYEGNPCILSTARDITERKRSREKIIETRNFLQSALDALTTSIALLDAQGKILLVNSTWREFAEKNGVSAEAVSEGVNYLNVCCSAAGDRREEARPFAQGIQRVISGETDFYALRYPCHSPTEERWFTGRVTPIPGETPRQVVVAHENITRRKKAEEALEQALGTARLREGELAALLDGARSVLEFKGFEEAARAIFDACKLQTGAAAGFVELFSADGQNLEYILLDSGNEACRVEENIPLPVRGMREKALQEGGPVYENRFAESGWAGLLPEGHVHLDSVLLVPLKVDGEQPGIIGLANKPGGFSADDARLARGFGELASIAFRNSRNLDALNDLNRDLERRVEERTTELVAANDELANALQVLQESEERFSAFMDTLPAGALIKEPDGKISYLNRYAWERFGRAGSWIGKTTGEILPPETAALLVDDDRRVFREGAVTREFSLRDVEGIEHVVELHKFPIKRSGKPDLIGGIAMDITEKKSYETRLRENYAMLQTVFDGIPDPLILMDARMKWKRVNRAATSYFGPMVKGAKEKPCFEAADSDKHCDACSVRDAVSRGRNAVFERESLLDPEKTERVSVYHVFDQDGRPTGDVIFRIQDITEELKFQEELVHSEKMVSLGVLVSGVAHEINNPNNLIMLNIPLLLEIWEDIVPILDDYYEREGDLKVAGLGYGEIKGDVPSLFKAVEEGARRIKVIVHELKEYSARGDVHTLTALDVNEPLRKAAYLLNHQIKKKTASFSVSYGENMPYVDGNLQALEQVFINLINNALEALPDKEKGVWAASYFDPEHNRVIIDIRDEGVGISPENLSNIRDPFFTTRRSSGGTGIGLAICDRIVERHKGRLEIKSEVGKGSLFRIVLPVRRTGEMSNSEKE